MRLDLKTDRLQSCDAVVGLTPSGLGRLAAVLGSDKGKNPYPRGTPQHAAWDENYRDVEALETLDIHPRQSAKLQLVRESRA
jgi:hypothetical protein